MYDLIWKRTVASQMVPAELDRTQIVIDLKHRSEQFVAQGEVVRFDGFMRLYSESVDDDAQQEGEGGILPKMSVGDNVQYHTMVASERYSVAPSRYNEATLVKRLEELGIGRPSTYAPTITTITNRGYVVKQSKEGQKRQVLQLTLASDKITEKLVSESYGKEKNRLAPTDIGMVVNDYLETQFSSIMDYHFTANVEKEFDRVAEGEITWTDMIRGFYDPFHTLVNVAIGTQNDRNTQPARVLGVDPKTGLTVKARIGRYGPMVELESADGVKGQFASLKKGQLIESITLEEALELFALPRNLGDLDGEALMVGVGKFGPYVRHGKTFASLSKSDDPYTITRERAEELLKENAAKQRAQAEPLRTFVEDANMVIKSGLYGPYIAYNGKNYRLPKGAKIETLTFAECQRIIAKSKK